MKEPDIGYFFRRRAELQRCPPSRMVDILDSDAKEGISSCLKSSLEPLSRETREEFFARIGE